MNGFVLMRPMWAAVVEALPLSKSPSSLPEKMGTWTMVGGAGGGPPTKAAATEGLSGGVTWTGCPQVPSS